MKNVTPTDNANQKKFRLGLAGSGMIATVSYGVLPNIKLIADKVDVVAIADPVIDLARSVAAQYDIPGVYSDVNEMLSNQELDGVINLTPIPVHYEVSNGTPVQESDPTFCCARRC